MERLSFNGPHGVLADASVCDKRYSEAASVCNGGTRLRYRRRGVAIQDARDSLGNIKRASIYSRNPVGERALQ